MQSAIKPLVRTLVFYLLSVLAIAAVLVVGGFVLKSVQDWRMSSEDWKALAQVQAEVKQYREHRAARLAASLDGAGQLPLATLERRIAALTCALQAAAPPAQVDLRALLRTGPEQYPARLAAHYRALLERELAAQELAYLQQVRAQLVVLESRGAAQRELERLHRAHVAAYGRYLEKRRELDRLGYLDRRLMQSDWAITPALRRLARELAARHMDNERAAAAWKAQRAALDRIGRPGELRPFALDAAALERAVRPLDDLVAEVGEAVTAHPVARLGELLLPALPVAAGVLLACLAGRFALRAFFYFVLAPLATRRPALRLDGAAARGGGAFCAAPSAVSQTIALDPSEELLVLPRCLQTSPVSAVKTTRWLLRGRWWSSLVSGMVLLTCVRTAGRDEEVVLGAGDGSFGELALIGVPAGSALVLQPRALVGMVCGRDTPPRVERRWRLASLHAWLTLQLRYFLVHGPVTLVVQGRRGVRVERADGARLVRQAATLGFSADVAYSTQRSSPFIPYLQGQADLLYDRFAGGRGIYVYDETPGGAHRGGPVKRGLEGLTDGVLKVFGL